MPTLTKLFSEEETATHNTKDDCWIVIDGKVYDVSAYLDDHPGGEDVILETAGKDATDDFEDAGHSKDARNTMKDFFIGEIDTPSSPDIPELEIFRKNQPAQDLLDLTKQYWAVPLAVAGISVVVGIMYLRRN